MAFLAGAEAPERPGSGTPGSATAAHTMAFETFYELKKMAHEEYSVLSLLENVAGHDRENIAQTLEILAADG
jgi:hypothetical protein